MEKEAKLRFGVLCFLSLKHNVRKEIKHSSDILSHTWRVAGTHDLLPNQALIPCSITNFLKSLSLQDLGSQCISCSLTLSKTNDPMQSSF